MSNNIYIQNLERKMWFSLTEDEEAGCKEEGRKHKKSKDEASLDLKPHVALWKRVAIIRINIRKIVKAQLKSNKDSIHSF